MTNWIAAGHKPDAVISNNDNMAIGAINAMKAAGWDMKDVIVGGVDATQEALAYMKAGDLDVTVFQNAAGQGGGAVDAAMKLAKGEKVERKVWVPFELVTPANMDSVRLPRTDRLRVRLRKRRRRAAHPTSRAEDRSGRADRMVSPATMQAVRESGAVPQSEYLLEVEGVRKEFPGVLALDNVQFRLKRGTVHALMGENGAGKSTLMKIIAGIYTPDTGTFRLRGKEIRLDVPLDALENGIAMIHQELNLMPSMTVAENIWIRREPKNRFGFVDHGEMHRKTADLFERLNIDIDPEVKVGKLTVANRQMVEIAKAVSYESDVLIMDEPTSALTEREVDAPVHDHSRPRAAGQRHHLHHPQDERAVRDRRRGLGVPRRQVHRHQVVEGCNARRNHPHDGGARDHPDVSQGDRADRRGGAFGQGPGTQGRLPRRLLRCARRRNPRHCRSGRLGPLATSPRRFSA